MRLAILTGLCLGFLLIAPAQAQPTAAAVGESLLSGETARIDEAMKSVRNGPGAYPPILFALVARTLAQKGELEEAAKWQLFGEFRMSADLILLSADGGATRELRPTAVALGAYNQGRDAQVVDYINTLSFPDKSALLDDVVRLDVTAPRYYPADWARMMRTGADNPMRDDWATRNAVWPPRALAVRTLVGASLKNQFAEELGLTGALRR